MLLLDLAAGATWFAGRYGDGQPDALRLFLIWALPGFIFLCGLLTREKKPRRTAGGPQPAGLRLPGIPLPVLPPARPVLPVPRLPIAATTAGATGNVSLPPASGPRWSRLLVWIGVAVAVDLAPFGIADRLGWLTFTFGEATALSNRLTTTLWMLPLLVVVSIRFSERTLRGQLFVGLSQGWGPPRRLDADAALRHGARSPAAAPGFAFVVPGAAAAALVTALGREIGSIVLFRASGLVAAGLFRGSLVFCDFFLIADWLRPAFPSAAYSLEYRYLPPVARRFTAGRGAPAGPDPAAGAQPSAPTPHAVYASDTARGRRRPELIFIRNVSCWAGCRSVVFA